MLREDLLPRARRVDPAPRRARRFVRSHSLDLSVSPLPASPPASPLPVPQHTLAQSMSAGYAEGFSVNEGLGYPKGSG
eukprot:349934-Chlamydomonas_euryale.AAC.3